MRSVNEIKKTQADSYREAANLIEEKLTDNNKKYFDDLRTYLITAGLFFDEEEINQQVYELGSDLLEAQQNDERAEDYFGMDAKGAADEMIRNFKKTSLKERVKISSLAIGIFWLFKIMSDVSGSGSIKLNVLSYFFSAVFVMIVLVGVFKVLHYSIYSKEQFFNRNKIGKFILLWLAMFGVIGGFVLIHLYTPELWVVTIPAPYDLLMIGVLVVVYAGAIITMRWRDFYPTIIIVVVLGIFGLAYRIPFFAPILSGKNGLWINLGVLLIAYTAYIIWTTRKVKEARS